MASETVDTQTVVDAVVREGPRPVRRKSPVQTAQLLPLAVVLLACVLTALSFQTSWVRLAYRLPRMHGVFQMAIGLVSVLVAYLFYGRVRAYGRWRDLVLAFALGFGAAVNVYAAIDQGVSTGPPDRLDVWTVMFGRVLVALLFAAAAIIPADRSGPTTGLPRFFFVIGIAFYALFAVVAITALQLPWSEELTTSPTDASKALFVGPTVLIVLGSVIPIAYSLAGWRFVRSAPGDDLMIWVAAACMVFALAGLDYLAFPSLFSDWVYVGDFLILAGVLLLLVGAASEIRGYWQRTAALDERRKIASELHDGVAQELAFIATMAGRLQRDPDGRNARRLADAAQHALDESRLVIATLAGAGDPGEQLALTARDAGHRFDLAVFVEVPPTVDLPSDVVEALLRIVRESINNVGHHAHADTVRVTLRVAHGVTLLIDDDGDGFDTAVRTTGFGVPAMRERAEAVGGTLTVTSVPGAGTSVCVRIPRP